MAKNQTAAPALSEERDWRAESDKDSLLRAAEIVADRIRLRAAMAKMQKQKRGLDKMLNVLARR